MANDVTIASAAYDTTAPKFGTAALSGGRGTSASAPFTSTGQTRTSEAWVKAPAANNGGTGVIVGTPSVWWGIDSTNHLTFSEGTVSGTDTSVLSSSAWTHVAVVSTSTGATMYINGVSTVTATGSVNNNPTGLLGVRDFPSGSASFPFNGKVDEIALWNTARYTSNFTPPTSAYAGTEAGLLALYHLNSSGVDSAVPVTTQIAPNNAAIIYSPYNWYANGTVEAVVWNHCGYFYTMFTGSATCALTFDLSQLSTSAAPEIWWRIDNSAWTRTAISATVTLTIPTVSGTNSNTYHYLEVRVAGTDDVGNRFSATAAPRLRFTGIVLDSGATVLQPIPHSFNILIFGDSIVEGAQALQTLTAEPYPNQADGAAAWAAQMREMLGAEVGQVGWGSTGYTVSHLDVPTFPNHWNLLATGRSRVLTPDPDLVIINHGTNDAATDITVAAKGVVNSMLTQWPRTRIILLNPIPQPTDPQPRAHPNTYLQAAARTCNDPARVTFLDTLGLYDYSKGSASPGFHPSQANVSGLLGKNLANLLRPYLAQKLIKRWTYA